MLFHGDCSCNDITYCKSMYVGYLDLLHDCLGSYGPSNLTYLEVL